MIETTIYTAGIMDSVRDTPTVMSDWRDSVLDYFSLYEKVRVLNPTRRPHFSDLNDKEVFNLDMKDIEESNILIADCRLHEGRSTFGTPAEIFYFSHILKRPVIGWYDEKDGYNEKSVFQNVLVDRFFGSLEKALEHVEEYYV